MKLLYTILFALFISCSTEPEVIHGCLDSTACNYNSSATIDNNSCEYVLEYRDCSGNCLIDSGCDEICSYKDLESNSIFLSQNGEIWLDLSNDGNISTIEFQIKGIVDSFEFFNDYFAADYAINDTSIAVIIYGDLYSGVIGQVETNQENLSFFRVIAIDSDQQYLPINYYDNCECCSGEDSTFEAFIYDEEITQSAIIKLNEPLGCCYSVSLSNNSTYCGEESENIIDDDSCTIDSGDLEVISSEDFFGTDCNLYYDSKNYLLTGYEKTTLMNPAGTGESPCNPNYINISSGYGGVIFEAMPSSIENIPLNIKAVPNPYVASCCSYESSNNFINFTNLPENCTIDIYDANYQIINSINHNNDFYSINTWDLKDNQNELIDTGIYIYEVLVDGEKIFRNSVIIKMLE